MTIGLLADITLFGDSDLNTATTFQPGDVTLQGHRGLVGSPNVSFQYVFAKAPKLSLTSIEGAFAILKVTNRTLIHRMF